MERSRKGEEETMTPSRMTDSISGRLKKPRADPRKSLKADDRAVAEKESGNHPSMGEMKPTRERRLKTS